MELRLVFGPDLYHRPDALVHQLAAGAGIGAVVLHLLAVPAHTDAEDYSSSGYEIQGRDFLGRDDRVSLDYQGYPGAEQQAFGCCGSGGEGDEGVQSPVVPSRQFSTARPGGLTAEGYVGVLGDEQRVEAALLDRSGQGSWGDSFVGNEC